MVPMLDLVIELAGEAAVRNLVLGMAHRGRLNVLAHTVGRPYEVILSEFEGNKGDATPDGGTGDVKYHHGAEGAFLTASGRVVKVTLLANPSHLEFIDPVVNGRARAEQTNRHDRRCTARLERRAPRRDSWRCQPSPARVSWPRR